jgi:hypothetical protein
MDREPASRTIVTTVLLISLVAGLAACQPSGASPSGSAMAASPGPTASAPAPSSSDAGANVGSALGGAVSGLPSAASPKPSIDVAAAFRKVMQSRFTAKVEIEGQMTVGSESYGCTGSGVIDGPDNHQVLTVAGSGVSDRSETLTVAGAKYVKRGELWFEETQASQAAGGGSFGSALRSALDVVDAGVETRHGRSLHHLTQRSKTPIPVTAIGIDDPDGDGTLAIDFYVDDDGTPVIMAMVAEWTAVSGSTPTPTRMSIDFTFVDVGEPVVIERPGRAWSTFTSKRFGYSVAYPADWETEQSTGKKEPDSLLSADLAAVYVYRYPRQGYSLNASTSSYIDALKHGKTKGKVTSNTATTVGGVRSRRLEWTGLYQGERFYNIELVVVRGKYVYFFQYTTDEKIADADRELVDLFRGSVTFTTKGSSSSSASRLS